MWWLRASIAEVEEDEGGGREGQRAVQGAGASLPPIVPGGSPADQLAGQIGQAQWAAAAGAARALGTATALTEVSQPEHRDPYELVLLYPYRIRIA